MKQEETKQASRPWSPILGDQRQSVIPGQEPEGLLWGEQPQTLLLLLLVGHRPLIAGYCCF